MTPHMKEPGYVYILTNPSFRDNWVKIGKSSRPVEQRVKVAEPLRSLRVPSNILREYEPGILYD